MRTNKKGILISLIISLAFFLVGFFTLSDYGISWDEPIHFLRGQDYLHFFLTGEKKFDTITGKKSYFQNNEMPASYFFEQDSGHPPLNGILAAFTNYIFYQRLQVMGDIQSHNLFNLLISSLLVFIAALFAFETYGVFAAVISGLSLFLYPLFFAESRFNIKDPAEAAFFGLTIYAFWKAVNGRNWKWLILSAIGFGMGLSTKFNILFLPLILIPWAGYKLFYLDGKINFNKKLILALIISPIIILIIFFGTWPYLWADPFHRLLEIFGYYKQIGTGFNYQTAQYYLPHGLNAYAIFWILVTTPPYIMLLFTFGLAAALMDFRRKDGATILWLLWFVIPVLRVTLPGTSIYGGVRQIMEYIPAMALIAGLGALLIKKVILKKIPQINSQLLSLFILLGFLQISLVLIKMHPNENVYFNSLIGGLPGARAANVPSSGNSFGNAYYQAVEWLNKNAETGARVALVQGTSLNIPRIMFRSDIVFNNELWSAINRQGEYMLELTHQNSAVAYPYAWDYIERVLNPVYEVKVDGVAIAKVWKNDLAHTKSEFQRSEVALDFKPQIITDKKTLLISLSEETYLTRIQIGYSEGDCQKPQGSVSTSIDDLNYVNQPDPYPTVFVTELKKQPDTIYQYFAVPKVKFIKFTDKLADSCLFNNPVISIKGFK